MASTEKGLKKDKNQNIQVFVRLRPVNARERSIRSIQVVDVLNNKEVVVKQSQQTSHTKKFTFDRAFGPNAQQVEIYKEVVSPLIAEVLAGYNCTVFAYGQTGTGKTHTMVGENSGEGTTWQNDPLAGIIPRSLSQLFDELRLSNTEYTVRVSYLELYNEELFDLLSTSNDNSKLRIYEDVARKGSTIVNGLEEITVYNKNEVYEIMAQGQERKRVASTLMNAQSSNPPKNKEPDMIRSHTVFTIVVHMKEICPKGEELVKIGKLNLVDLAGSENISKSGSDNPAKRERARECVNINQSLLTLGRVITALVEKHPHIPYRESKLTRILQESLGGRTKTSIIATVSPGHKDLEETMSTLEYANRARNIQNKPEVNQKLTKQAMLKGVYEEIDRLKRELGAAREKNGVYLPTETFEEITAKQEEQKREIQELLLKIRSMEDEKEKTEALFRETSERAQRTEADLAATRVQLNYTQSRLSDAEQTGMEQKALVGRHVVTERELTAQALEVIAAADTLAGDAARLHDTVARRTTVELTNQELISSYREESTAHRRKMIADAQRCTDSFTEAREHIQITLDDHTDMVIQMQELNTKEMKAQIEVITKYLDEMEGTASTSSQYMSEAREECAARLPAATAESRARAQLAVDELVRAVRACVERVQNADVARTVADASQKWCTEASGRVSCLCRSQAAHGGRARDLEARRLCAARDAHDARLAALEQRRAAIASCVAKKIDRVESLRADIDHLHCKMTTDREETERALHELLERERRALEERMAAHMERERARLNQRLNENTDTINKYKSSLDELVLEIRALESEQQRLGEGEAETAAREMEEITRASQETLRGAHEFQQEFDDGTSAITAEMEAFTQSVGRIVSHTTDRLLEELCSTETRLQENTLAVTSSLESGERQALETALGALAGVQERVGGLIQQFLQHSKETSQSSISTYNAMLSRCSDVVAMERRTRTELTAANARAAEEVHKLNHDLRADLHTQAETEGRYLMREYRVYTPTGDTPARREYRYPRRLVSTSPHQRILARLRNQRHQHNTPTNSPQVNGHSPNDSLRSSNSPDSDCAIVEDRHTSDSDVSESSVSSDSAVMMQ